MWFNILFFLKKKLFLLKYNAQKKFGDLRDDCKAAGAHFNPFKKTHGAPSDQEQQVGDLVKKKPFSFSDLLPRIVGFYFFRSNLNTI